MINRIIVSFIFVEMLIALSIMAYWTINNIEPHTLELGSPFLAFMSQCNQDLSNFRIEIPIIPKIDSLQPITTPTGEWYDLILNFFIGFANAFFGFINAITTIINILIQGVNLIIQLVEFFVIVLKNIFVLRDTLQSQPVPSSSSMP